MTDRITDKLQFKNQIYPDDDSILTSLRNPSNFTVRCMVSSNLELSQMIIGKVSIFQGVDQFLLYVIQNSRCYRIL